MQNQCLAHGEGYLSIHSLLLLLEKAQPTHLLFTCIRCWEYYSFKVKQKETGGKELVKTDLSSKPAGPVPWVGTGAGKQSPLRRT